MLRYVLILILFISVIIVYKTDRDLRDLSEKRIRYFRSFLFSASYSEEPINNFEQLKTESYVAAASDLFERIYFGWPFATPEINVSRSDGVVCVEEDRDYPVSLFKKSRIVLKIDVAEK